MNTKLKINMNTLNLKIISIATFVFLTAVSINKNTVTAQSLTDYAVPIEGLTVAQDVTADVMIVLDNSASMRNSLNDTIELVGGHHPNSRAFEARRVIREVLADIEGDINVGMMEYDIAWTKQTNDANRWAISTCGDLSPSPVGPYHDGYVPHTPTPLFPDCPNPLGYTLDKYNRIPANNPDTTYYNVFQPNDTGIGRLRVAIQPLTPEHLVRLDNVLGPPPEMPELRCRRNNADSDTINGVRTCEVDAPYVDDFDDTGTTPNFAAGTPGTGTSTLPFDPTDEQFRIRSQSHDGGSSVGNGLRYGFNKSLLPDADNDNIPDLYDDPTAPSLTTFGTATYGSILSAQNYMRGVTGNFTTLLDDNDLQPDDLNFTPASSSTETTPSAAQCTVKSYILVITDGQPFTLLDGSNINSSGKETCNNPILALDEMDYACNITAADSKITAHSKNTIAPLLAAMRLGYRLEADGTPAAAATNNYSSIETFIFGFSAGINAEGVGIMNTLAAAGSKIENEETDGTITYTDRPPFLSDTPDQLKADLLSAFASLAPPLASGSGVAVVASSTDAAGAVVQAAYAPTLTQDVTDALGNVTTDSVSWTGDIKSYFIDNYGFLREDGDEDGALDNYATDPVFTLDFDTSTTPATTTAQRYTVTDIGTEDFTITADGDPVQPNEINPVWSAAPLLTANALADTSAGGVGDTQRPYNTPANATDGFRYIFTWTQNNPLSLDFDAGTQEAFLPTMIDDTNYGLFGITEADSTIGIPQAQNIIRFIRGEEGLSSATGAAFRDRTLDDQPYLLGDIVHSSAAVVDTPASDFVSRFGDTSYQEFQDTYQLRRRMVYAGGNDGLLHAFNAGFWDSANTRFVLRESDLDNTCLPSNCDDAEHELGAEMWAYAPMNLFPHLQFLTRSDYQENVHVAYVDGPIKTFDVQAWGTSDTDGHVNGWGTILVANMRLGGGDYTVDPDNDASTVNSFTTRSAYIILDITDPSEPPTVIAEITDPDIGFATSEPSIQRDGDNWYLVFGSGPNNPFSFISEDVIDPVTGIASVRSPKFYRYRLDEGSRALEVIDVSTSESSFVGNTRSHDWDSDETDDAVYFGVIGGNELAPSGNGMYRFISDPSSINDGSISLLVDTGVAPPVAAPLLVNSQGKNWVSFGTGRFFTDTDLLNTTQNTLYGVIEPRGNYDTPDASELIDMTGVTVAADDGALNVTVSGQTTYDELQTFILTDEDVTGWKTNIDATYPSDKITLSPQIFGEELLYIRFSPPTPSDDICEPTYGDSFLGSVNIATGLPTFVDGFEGTLDLDDGENGSILNQDTLFGNGYIAAFGLLTTLDPETNETRGTAIGGDQGGGLPTVSFSLVPSPDGRTSWRELEIQ